jgi:hypothetical protein
MKVIKVELFFVDFDGVGVEGARDVIETARYPNRCVSPVVLSVEGRDIGPQADWHDDHPLNRADSCADEIKRLFAEGQS